MFVNSGVSDGDKSVNIRSLARELHTCINSNTLDRARRLVSSLDREQRAAVARKKTHNDETLLCRAVTRRRTSFLPILLDECFADIEQCYFRIHARGSLERTSALCHAAELQDIRSVRILVEYGADVNAGPPCLWGTPLHWACATNNLSIAKYLIDHGASVKRTDIDGTTCLMHCVRNTSQNCHDLCQLLLCAGASVSLNDVDGSGNTALHYAVRSRSADRLHIVSLFLRHGADTSVCNKSGNDVLQEAALFVSPKILELLIDESNPTPLRRADLYSLLAAQIAERPGSVRAAVDFWKKALSFRTQGVDPLVFSGNHVYGGAVEARDVETLEAMAEDSDALLTQALICRERILGGGHEETLQWVSARALYYIRSGALQRSVTLYRHAALTLSGTDAHRCSELHVNYVKALYTKYDRDPGSVGFDDVAKVVRVMVQVIKSRESDWSKDGLMGAFRAKTILHIIIYVVDLLRRLTSSETQFLWLKQLVRKDLIEPAWELMHGRTFLHFVIDRCSSFYHPLSRADVSFAAVVDVLLEAGADVNAVDAAGNSPLHLATRSASTAMSTAPPLEGGSSMVEALLRHGAHVDLRNTQGDFALPGAINEIQHINLQCLAARAIRHHRVSYRNVLPPRIADFVDLH